jgi:hypothetical protein
VSEWVEERAVGREGEKLSNLERKTGGTGGRYWRAILEGDTGGRYNLEESGRSGID